MHTGERYREKEGQAEARGWPNIFFSHSGRQTGRQTSLLLFNTFRSYQLINLASHVMLYVCVLEVHILSVLNCHLHCSAKLVSTYYTTALMDLV